MLVFFHKYKKYIKKFATIRHKHAKKHFVAMAIFFPIFISNFFSIGLAFYILKEMSEEWGKLEGA